MLHYTLNTNHTRVSPRSEVADSVLPLLGDLLATGRHALPLVGPGYIVAVTLDGTGLMATVSCGGRPCVTFAVAPDEAAADAIWTELERFYLSLGDIPGIRAADFAAPHRPAATPWCGAVTVLPTREEAYWIADFERCLAWAWIERVRSARH